MIADTDFIIDLSRGDEDAAAKLSEIRKRNEPLAVTVVTQYELWRGAGKLSGKEHSVLSDVIGNSMIIVLEPENAHVAGIISHALSKKGIAIGSRDCLIAGIVLSGNDTLLTRNMRDFSRIAGLQLETY